MENIQTYALETAHFHNRNKILLVVRLHPTTIFSRWLKSGGTGSFKKCSGRSAARGRALTCATDAPHFQSQTIRVCYTGMIPTIQFGPQQSILQRNSFQNSYLLVTFVAYLHHMGVSENSGTPKTPQNDHV